MFRTHVKWVVVVLTLAGCGQHEQPTPFPELPTLDRPVTQVIVRKGTNLQIPSPALTERGGIPGVFVLKQGEARFRMIKTGRRTGGRIDVLSGLTGNETLVLGDLSPVHDGSPITKRGK